MTRRRNGRAALVLPGGLAAGALAGTVATIAVIGGPPAPAAPKPPPVTTAPVQRTTLETSVLTQGTLGYAATRPLRNQLTGTYTQLPAAGRRIVAGGVLYRVDDQPAVLLYGRVPAWRAMGEGITPGPDVTELERNLIALGYASGLFSAPTAEFTAATAAAVNRWQAATGQPVTGQAGLGSVVFLPGPARVGAPQMSAGDPATPGQAPYQVTTDTRVVTVPLNPVDSPAVSAGERVRIQLPSGTWVAGRVTAVGPPAPAAAGPPGGGQGGSPGSSGGSPADASAVAAVRPVHPRQTGSGSGVPVQVALPTGSARNVLAVPVSALVALAGGGYAVELAGPHGGHRLVAVRTGLFSGALVQVSGTGLQPGVKVVTAQ